MIYDCILFCVVATIEFSQPEYNVNENNKSVDLILNINKPSSFPYTVTVVTNDRSAGKLFSQLLHDVFMFILPVVGASDYVSRSYTVNVTAGDTEVTLSISIKNDDIFEVTEYFAVFITDTSKPDSIMTGRTSQAIVSILDDDRKHLTVIYIVCM